MDAERIQEEIAEKFIQMLPHGSGIDCKWGHLWQKDGKLICNNSFHCMDYAGIYDGFAEFKLRLSPRKALTAFEVSFTGMKSQYLNHRYQLREYLVDTIYNALAYNQAGIDAHHTSLYMLLIRPGRKSVFVATVSKQAALRRSMLQNPIALKVDGGFLVYNAY